MADRAQLFKEIQETSFMVDDLTLYLDTHPLDEKALNAFDEAKKKRYELLKSYADEYEPLNLYLVCGQHHFTWTDGPLPWDNQGGV